MKYVLGSGWGFVLENDELGINNYRNIKVFDNRKDAAEYMYDFKLSRDDFLIWEVDEELFNNQIHPCWTEDSSLSGYLEELATEQNDYDVSKIKNMNALLEIKNKLQELGLVDMKIYEEYTIDDIIRLNRKNISESKKKLQERRITQGFIRK